MKPFKSIILGSFSKDDAEKIKEKLQDKTFMYFDVLVCPAGGCFEVVVETAYKEATQKEFQEMLFYVMACELTK